MSRTALVMAGGTGGHIFPGLAVAEALRERGWRVHWLGAPGSMEEKLVPPRGFAFEPVQFGGVRGKGLVTLALLPLRLLRAFWQSIGVACVIVAFFWLARRLFHIGRQAIALERVFAGLFAQGIGIWVGGQAFINMGVNLGVLPTKGLTLPLMSYGGSAIVMNMIALAIVLRVDIENRQLMRGGRA